MGQLAQATQGRQLVPMQQAAPGSLTEQAQYAERIAGAGIIPAAYKGRPADILVAIGLGQSMGLAPMESLYRINVIQGKPTASAELIAAQVRKAGHRLRVRKDPRHMSVTASIVRADDPEFEFTATRNQQWAERMGLAGKDNYKRQPLTMLTWRAITAVAREACPEALYGVAYTPDEMHDMDRTPVQSSTIAEPEAQPEQQAAPTDPLAAKKADMQARFAALGYDGAQIAETVAQLIGRTPKGPDDMSEAELDKVLADLKGAVKEGGR